MQPFHTHGHALPLVNLRSLRVDTSSSSQILCGVGSNKLVRFLFILLADHGRRILIGKFRRKRPRLWNLLRILRVSRSYLVGWFQSQPHSRLGLIMQISLSLLRSARRRFRNLVPSINTNPCCQRRTRSVINNLQDPCRCSPQCGYSCKQSVRTLRARDRKLHERAATGTA